MEFVSIKAVCSRLSIGRTKLWELMKEPDFPKTVRVTTGRKVFVKSEIEAWMAARVQERDLAA